MNNQTIKNDPDNRYEGDIPELENELRSIWLPLVDVLRTHDFVSI